MYLNNSKMIFYYLLKSRKGNGFTNKSPMLIFQVFFTFLNINQKKLSLTRDFTKYNLFLNIVNIKFY